jgi:hypothetical protein
MLWPFSSQVARVKASLHTVSKRRYGPVTWPAGKAFATYSVKGVINMRNLLWTVPALLLGMQICASADTILPGTQVAVKTDQPIEMHTWDRGRIYPARVARDVFARNGELAIPRGSYAELIVRAAI